MNESKHRDFTFLEHQKADLPRSFGQPSSPKTRHRASILAAKPWPLMFRNHLDFNNFLASIDLELIL